MIACFRRLAAALREFRDNPDYLMLTIALGSVSFLIGVQVGLLISLLF